MSEELRVHRGEGVVEVTFDRPQRHNAFTREMYAGMHALCDELHDDTSVKVLVLRGAGGRAFAAGNEISDFLSQDAVAYENWIRELLESLFALPQVTIAAIDGVCVGGGLAVATHCDLRIATPGSRFGYPIARTLGNALSASIVYRCAAIFGESLTREMLLTSRLTTAERAYAVGALMAVTDSLDDELATVVDGRARGLRRHPARHQAAAAPARRPPRGRAGRRRGPAPRGLHGPRLHRGRPGLPRQGETRLPLSRRRWAAKPRRVGADGPQDRAESAQMGRLTRWRGRRARPAARA